MVENDRKPYVIKACEVGPQHEALVRHEWHRVISWRRHNPETGEGYIYLKDGDDWCRPDAPVCVRDRVMTLRERLEAQKDESANSAAPLTPYDVIDACAKWLQESESIREASEKNLRASSEYFAHSSDTDEMRSITDCVVAAIAEEMTK